MHCATLSPYTSPSVPHFCPLGVAELIVAKPDYFHYIFFYFPLFTIKNWSLLGSPAIGRATAWRYSGRAYEMEHGNSELRTSVRTGGDAFRLWLCECVRRETMVMFRHCRPRYGTTSTRRAPQIASPLFHFILATTVPIFRL